jgi:multidrug efflux pump subunit AcrB
LTFEAQRSGPPGGDLDVRLLGGSVVELKEAAEEVALLLRKYGGVSDIEDNLPYGKPETHIELNSRGRALGFSTVTLASQVRDAVDGIVAKRFPRGEEEVWIRVQYDRQLVRAGLLNQLYVRAPNGSKVKLLGVADFKKETGFSSIRRENGQREVSIRAEVDMTITRPQYLRHALVRDGLEDICNHYGLTYKFGGRALDEKETTSDMLVGTVLGLVFIYIILAWVFSSYVRPLVIMAVIPTGFVGAVLGHAVWGFDLTILSIFAILGLSGIVINDSIILVRTVDERTPHEGLLDAVVNGSGDRLRAVILTSATTIGGLLPLLFETSLQAQFLIPMALTLVFGLALTTPIVLVLIPSLIVIEDDICRFFRQLNVQKILRKGL